MEYQKQQPIFPTQNVSTILYFGNNVIAIYNCIKSQWASLMPCVAFSGRASLIQHATLILKNAALAPVTSQLCKGLCLHKGKNIEGSTSLKNDMDQTTLDHQEREQEIARLLRKRTLRLGEEDTSSDEETTHVPKTSRKEEPKKTEQIDFDKLFPGWWREDQHAAECDCDFCLLYFQGRKATSSAAAISTVSESVDLDGAKNPSTPDAA